MNAEAHFYRGDWEAVIRIPEDALPTAWEIREWTVVAFASSWLVIAYLKLGKTDEAKRVLDRVLKEVPFEHSPPMGCTASPLRKSPWPGALGAPSARDDAGVRHKEFDRGGTRPRRDRQ
jgi:hypothetical protein